jgi:hypothetical protein
MAAGILAKKRMACTYGYVLIGGLEGRGCQAGVMLRVEEVAIMKAGIELLIRRRRILT